MPFSNETISKINLQSQNSMTTPLNLLDSIQSPRSEQSESDKDEETPLSTPPKLKLQRPPSIHIKKDKTMRSSTERGFHLSPPSKSSSFRRGTNTSGIENSFSFMKKILDDPDNDHDYEPESKQHLESSKLLVLKHCDSLNVNCKPANANRADLKINFSQKNISYQRKKHFTENSKTTKRQKSKSFTAKFTTHFRKKTNKFLKLLTNLLISFRNSGDETNSFIFTESRIQGDEKPILNLKEILRKKTIEEQQNSTTKSSKRMALQRSGTFMSEKYNNSAFSFASSPKTDLSKDVKDLNNSIFFINVHPPTKEDIIMESAENFEDTRQKRKDSSDEMDIIKRRTEEMRLNVEEEQQKLIKIQFFLPKKLWKLSLGILISNYKLLLINEKGFLFHPLPKALMEFYKTGNIRIDSQKVIREKRESDKRFKFSLEQIAFKERIFEHHEEEVEIMKRSAETEGNLSPPIEDESYEEVFEQDGGFIEDLKKTECNTHLKFSYQSKLDVDLEPLLMRKKANNFLKFLPEVAIPISTSLEHSFLDSNIPPNYNTDLEILDSSFFSKLIGIY